MRGMASDWRKTIGAGWIRGGVELDRDVHGPDPMARILARHEIHESEDRYVAIGLAEAKALVVVFTQRRQNIRIISARKATSPERRRYGAHFG